MRSEFENLEEIANLFKIGNFQFNEDKGNYTGTKGTALSYLRGAWWSWKGQQSKVDELQKRVDAAQKVADKMVKGTISVSMFAYELEQAFKGGCDE